MLNSTLEHLRCPKRRKGKTLCGGALALKAGKTIPSRRDDRVFDAISGSLECRQCRARFPILGGVAVLVDDVAAYLLSHVKGISQVVSDSEIPREYLSEYLEAKDQIELEHIEEDLEAERVNALYLMNHYLHAENSSGPNGDWWRPRNAPGSPLIDELVRKYWDQGPLARIQNWIGGMKGAPSVVELGCGVGSLSRRLGSGISRYLGVDSSFASVALGRHLALGSPHPGKIRIPEDLLQGPVSREVKIPLPDSFDGKTDFVVGEIEGPPLESGVWDVSVALNAIDMLEDPAVLPALQGRLIRREGRAIQSCPYIWHEIVARRLRSRLPKGVRDSAGAVEFLYGQAGFEIETREDHVPWLFFKHARQLEIYSVHLFVARKK